MNTSPHSVGLTAWKHVAWCLLVCAGHDYFGTGPILGHNIYREMTHISNTRLRRDATFRNTFFEVRNTFGRRRVFVAERFAPQAFFGGGESFCRRRREKHFKAAFAAGDFFQRSFSCLAPQAIHFQDYKGSFAAVG